MDWIQRMMWIENIDRITLQTYKIFLTWEMNRSERWIVENANEQ